VGLNGFTSGPVVSREVAQDIVRQSFCGEEMDADFPWRGRFRLLVVIYLLATRHGFGMCGVHAGGRRGDQRKWATERFGDRPSTHDLISAVRLYPGEA
jgi:hypothetical protein